MPDFTIPDLKMALVEVKRICKERTDCDGCPFDIEKSFCPLTDRPDKWFLDYYEAYDDENG